VHAEPALDTRHHPVAANDVGVPADPLGDELRVLDLRRQLKECDAKLARYRQLLEQDANIAVVATWIAEVELVAVLADADPADKRAIYDELGVNLPYHPSGRVQVGAGGRVLGVRVGGGT
jgi:hypothetical protein